MTDLTVMGSRAVAVKFFLQKLSGEEKSSGLLAAARTLEEKTERILAANEKDMENAVKSGMSEGL